MKKSLLMTIIMSLVLVVAMSTATYAWYTASNRVTVASTEVTAATSSSSNLGIGATGGASNTNCVILMEDAISPMIPTTEWTIGTTTIGKGTNTDIAFKTATRTANSLFSNDVADATPATITSVDGDDTKTSFYVSNKNKDASVSVNATVTITDADSRGLCVALFADSKLIGVWGDTVHYGTITAGSAITTISNTMTAEGDQDISELNPIVVKGSTKTHSVGEITAGGDVKIEVVAWFDGVDLTDSLSDGTATFSISFDAAD